MIFKTLIVCIGNDLVADDGVGSELYRSLTERALPPGVRVLFLGVGGIDLLDRLDGEELLIVVDAVQLGRPPGTVHVLAWDEIPSSETRPVSGHGIGVKEALLVCRRLYPEKAPRFAYLVGVEGSCFNRIGIGLSEPVQQALPEAIHRILELAVWRPSPGSDQPCDRNRGTT